MALVELSDCKSHIQSSSGGSPQNAGISLQS